VCAGGFFLTKSHLAWCFLAIATLVSPAWNSARTTQVERIFMALKIVYFRQAGAARRYEYFQMRHPRNEFSLEN
jgi:hypothetical protein